jgi:hypothetical protein
MQYFSDRERGSKPRIEEAISPAVWGGIVAFVNTLVSKGAFGIDFPLLCPDGMGSIGTDEVQLSLAIQAEIPDLSWPLETRKKDSKEYYSEDKPFAPDVLTVLDFIEFCYKAVTQPIQDSFHPFFGHHHLSFDVETGKKAFREKINTIFSRNGITYELRDDGFVIRLASPVIRHALTNTLFATGDSTLDEMLEEAQAKFVNPNVSVRREAVERLWDCWERIKTLEKPDDKRRSIENLLKKAVPGSENDILQMLDQEARKLTEIGNSFHIRHAEVTQIRIADSDQIDYLFHRLFAMIQLLLKKL